MDWCRWVRRAAEGLASGLLEPMGPAAAMGERHVEGLLGHGQDGMTTAFLEGRNRLCWATQRPARGYGAPAHQIALLYFVAGTLQIPYYG